MIVDSPQPLWHDSRAARITLHIADPLKRVVHAAVSQFSDPFLDGSGVVSGVEAIGGAELPGDLELGGVDCR